MYKATKEQVSVFGLRTQYGGGKTTGFGLVYDSPEALKKFEPQYRLVRVGLATKPERASRQQRRFFPSSDGNDRILYLRRESGTWILALDIGHVFWGRGLIISPYYRQATQEPTKDAARNRQVQGRQGEEGQINNSIPPLHDIPGDGKRTGNGVWEEFFGGGGEEWWLRAHLLSTSVVCLLLRCCFVP